MITQTCYSIANESIMTSAVVAPFSVETVGIFVTFIDANSTFIQICIHEQETIQQSGNPHNHYTKYIIVINQQCGLTIAFQASQDKLLQCFAELLSTGKSKQAVALKCLIQLWYMPQWLSVYIVTLTAAHTTLARQLTCKAL